MNAHLIGKDCAGGQSPPSESQACPNLFIGRNSCSNIQTENYGWIHKLLCCFLSTLLCSSSASDPIGLHRGHAFFD